MAQPRKPSPRPVPERLKAERIQELLRAMPEWRLSGAQIAAGAVTLTLTTAKTARALTPEELELAAALEKVA
jgi:pterin-4a-carbinolamine dehydratase